MNNGFNRFSKVFFALCYMLIFYIASGAIAAIKNLDKIQTMLVQGCFIWTSVILLVVYFLIRYKSPDKIGFRKIKWDSARPLLYFIPVIIVIGTNLWGGVNPDNTGKLVLASLLVTSAVGFSEEIICRGIVFTLLKEKSLSYGIIVSAVCFGVCHLFNIMGGADLVGTLIQICFAFFYGIVMAVIFYKTNSIFPCAIFHLLHDFCSFISIDVPITTDVAIGIIQGVILIAYGIYCMKLCKEDPVPTNPDVKNQNDEHHLECTV